VLAKSKPLELRTILGSALHNPQLEYACPYPPGKLMSNSAGTWWQVMGTEPTFTKGIRLVKNECNVEHASAPTALERNSGTVAHVDAKSTSMLAFPLKLASLTHDGR
jgi:hypothetical protein